MEMVDSLEVLPWKRRAEKALVQVTAPSTTQLAGPGSGGDYRFRTTIDSSQRH